MICQTCNGARRIPNPTRWETGFGLDPTPCDACLSDGVVEPLSREEIALLIERAFEPHAESTGARDRRVIKCIKALALG